MKLCKENRPLASFADKVKMSGNTYLLTGQWRGKKVWYRMQMSQLQATMLGTLIKNNHLFNLTEHGDVISSGWGEPPRATS